MEKTTLWIVIPCYCEEQVLPITAPMFLEELNKMINAGKISDLSRILFVNDGSKDSTWEVIESLSKTDQKYVGISLSRNRGHQNALLCGLMEAKKYCDITISIDCDGQDDISVMDRMVDEYRNGNEIVYGVRSSRKTDTWFKRNTAQLFYQLLNGMGAEVVYNHADYRLVSSRVLNEFSYFQETNLFLRGMFPLVGFQHSTVYYERYQRIAGEGHYPLAKMIGLAIDGITSLSVKPIKMITGFGITVSLLGFCGILYAIGSMISGHVVAGWTSMMCGILFMGGVQLLSIGIIGEYVGKTYMETKRRPRYIIEKRTYEE